MTTRLLSFLTIGCLVVALNGCSSSQTSDSPPDDVSEASAGTDAVPMESGDKPADVASADATPPPATDGAAPAAPDAMNKTPEDLPLTPGSAPVADAAQAAPASPELAQTTAPTDAPVVPAATPAADPAPAAAVEVAPIPSTVADSNSSSTSADGSYTVQHGDTLMRIAFETCGDLYKWKDIYDANRDQLKNPNVIIPGTVLKVPHSDSTVAHNGEKREIKAGETLGTISNDIYGTPRKWKKLWANNRDLIKNPNRIFAGFFLYYTVSPSDQEEIKNAPAPLADEHSQAPADQAAAAAPAPADAAAPVTPAPASMSAPSAAIAPAVPSTPAAPAAPAAPDTRSPASVTQPTTQAAPTAPVAPMAMTPVTH